jgi:hypothetical protein
MTSQDNGVSSSKETPRGYYEPIPLGENNENEPMDEHHYDKPVSGTCSDYKPVPSGENGKPVLLCEQSESFLLNENSNPVVLGENGEPVLLSEEAVVHQRLSESLKCHTSTAEDDVMEHGAQETGV